MTFTPVSVLTILSARAPVSHADAGLFEDALEFLRDFFIFNGDEARQHLEDGDFGSEAVEYRCELDSHRARSDDEHGFRDGGEVENFDVGEDRFRVGLEAGEHAGFRAGRDDDVLGFEGLRVFAVGHFDLASGAAAGQKLPNPLIQSTLFFFMRNSTPLACLATILFLRSMTLG